MNVLCPKSYGLLEVIIDAWMNINVIFSGETAVNHELLEARSLALISIQGSSECLIEQPCFLCTGMFGTIFDAINAYFSLVSTPQATVVFEIIPMCVCVPSVNFNLTQDVPDTGLDC